jgi:hypothetical protein
MIQSSQNQQVEWAVVTVAEPGVMLLLFILIIMPLMDY